MRDMTREERTARSDSQRLMEMHSRTTPWEAICSYFLPIVGKVDIKTRWGKYSVSAAGHSDSYGDFEPTNRRDLCYNLSHLPEYDSVHDAETGITEVIAVELKRLSEIYTSLDKDRANFIQSCKISGEKK